MGGGQRGWHSVRAVCPRAICLLRLPRNNWRRTQATPESLFVSSCLLVAEGEVHAREVFEVVLTRGCAGDVIGAEVGVQIVHFNWTQLNRLGDGDVQAHAVLHREPIIAPVARAASTLQLADVGIEIGMRGAKQSLSEGLKLAGVLLN